MSRSRSRSRGVTHIAAALALAAVGASASCVWWLQGFTAGRDADSTSRTTATEIHAAAKGYRALHAEGCPTLSVLEQEHLLPRNAREDDGWGNRFRVRCDEGELFVTSAGQDGKPGTADDLRFSR